LTALLDVAAIDCLGHNLALVHPEFNVRAFRVSALAGTQMAAASRGASSRERASARRCASASSPVKDRLRLDWKISRCGGPHGPPLGSAYLSAEKSVGAK
jgi:hypothetical protein